MTEEKSLTPISDVVKKILKQSANMVNHPTHYNSLGAVCPKCGNPIECIDVVREMNFNIGNSVKYLWRQGEKGDAVTDLKKAIWYIEDKIKRLEMDK
jgi:uncharacterized OB-fold protein